MSRGAIQRAVDQVSEAIAPYYEAAAGRARDAPVNYIDETAWYQHGVLAWLWATVNATVALFKVQARRNKVAFEAMIERWAGILVSDGYGVYQHWMHQRQTCLAHLIRRARGLSERKEPEVAWLGGRVMAEFQRLVQWAQAPPTAGEVQTWYMRMAHLLNQSRRQQDEAGTLARTLDREMGALWTFVVEQGVKPTNNQAEVRSVDQKPSVTLGGLVLRGAGGKACHPENSRSGIGAIPIAPGEGLRHLPRGSDWLSIRAAGSLTRRGCQSRWIRVRTGRE